MKKISTSILKSANWLLTGLLALLGFSSCDQVSTDMYGTPHSKFTIKGKVTNESNSPIPQIQIRSPYGEDIPHADTLYTDSKESSTTHSTVSSEATTFRSYSQISMGSRMEVVMLRTAYRYLSKMWM